MTPLTTTLGTVLIVAGLICAIDAMFRRLSARRAERSAREGWERLKRLQAVGNGLWRQDQGQDIAEYSVLLAVILVLVVGTVRLIGSNSVDVFSSVASSIQ